MTKTLLWLILSTLSVAPAALGAANARRQVSFSWEAVEDATLYEVELLSKIQGKKSYVFRTKAPRWSGRLQLGRYQMRARTFDDRGIPGDWSPPSEFDVMPEAAKPVSPQPGTEMAVKDAGAKEAEVLFKWGPVEGATQYRLTVHGDEKDFKFEKVLTETSESVRLPVASRFVWSVSTIAGDLEKPIPPDIKFLVQGPQLAKPQFVVPQSAFVRELSWTKAPEAESVRVSVRCRSSSKQRWIKLAGPEDRRDDRLPFASNWPGGRCQAIAIAQAPLYPNSVREMIEFDVFQGDRSEVSQEYHELRQSIDRPSGWYSTASYLLTQVQYASQNYDQTVPAEATYSALTSALRLGAGRWSKNSPWGFLGLVDSFVTKTNLGIVSNLSGEASVVRKITLSRRTELRLQLGAFVRESVVAISDGRSSSVQSYDKLWAIGPHVAAEMWSPLTPRWGVQANLHLFETAFALSTPNGKGLDPTLSLQYGLLASYRVSTKLKTLAGIEARSDKVRYESKPMSSAYSGQFNQISSNGWYLNLAAEYNF